MNEPVMCCGGTCVRALCEYHKDVPLEVEEPEPPTEPVPFKFVSFTYDPIRGHWTHKP